MTAQKLQIFGENRKYFENNVWRIRLGQPSDTKQLFSVFANEADNCATKIFCLLADS